MEQLTKALIELDASNASMQAQITMQANRQNMLKTQAMAEATERLTLSKSILDWTTGFAASPIFQKLTAARPGENAPRTSLCIYAPDMPGHGLDPTTPGASSLSVIAKDGSLVYTGGTNSNAQLARALVSSATPIQMTTIADMAATLHVQYLRDLVAHLSTDRVLKFLAKNISNGCS